MVPLSHNNEWLHKNLLPDFGPYSLSALPDCCLGKKRQYLNVRRCCSSWCSLYQPKENSFLFTWIAVLGWHWGACQEAPLEDISPYCEQGTWDNSNPRRLTWNWIREYCSKCWLSWCLLSSANFSRKRWLNLN